jgi:16S rRNA (guanine966-N2)-methyltransferase
MRVIAGELGGRRLKAPRGLETRPTSDRVREALFMSLEPLAGLRIADLFAGSGALGIEALSRGAAHVEFVESSGSALRALRENLESLGLAGRARVWRVRWPNRSAALSDALRACDLVLADPPYGRGAVAAVLRELGAPGRLRGGARVVVEHHGKDEVPERDGALALERARSYGETRLSWYRVDRPAAEAGRETPGSDAAGTRETA